jgi:hypothetical protein
MSHPVRFGLRALCLLGFALFCFTFTTVYGQEKKLKELNWSHAFDLACRKNNEKDIDKNTKRWGVEAFRDNNTGLGFYISETGCIAAAPNFATVNVPITPSKGPEWKTGVDMPTRKAGVIKWEKTTKVHSMEIFRDPNVDNWLYITDAGNIATTTGKLFPGGPGKDPKWVHSVDLQVRKGGVKDWKDAAKYGIEVYRDGNTGSLIYVTEHGHVAMIPEYTEVKEVKETKSPLWLHGLDLSCRRSDEKAFSKDTRKFGVEVYHDVMTGNLIFISETGCISVAQAPANIKAPTANAKEPSWTHGLNVRCRKYGEKEFTDKTQAFGAEVFVDENVGAILYINEKGNITTVSSK